MRVIASGRKTGKTTAIIEAAAEAEARGEVCYIVCHSQNEAYRIAQKAKELNLNIGFPITHDEFLQGQYSSQIHHLLIDNVEFLLQRLAKVPIEVVSINKERDVE